MEKKRKVQITRVTDKQAGIKYEQRELLFTRSTYSEQKDFFSYIRNGDIKRIKSLLEPTVGQEMPMGNLSANDVRQVKYMGIIFTTLATHAAMDAGAPEIDAYAMSDEAILHIDKLEDADEIIAYTFAIVIRTTQWVHDIKQAKKYPQQIRKCLEYIDLHLHHSITLEQLAQECNLSKIYLSKLFGREVGKTIPAYVRELRLAEAKKMLEQTNKTAIEIASVLGFGSQSYFIACFRKAFGITPIEYRNQLDRDYMK